MTDTPILGMTLWTEGQALPATRGNQLITVLEFFATGGLVISASTTAPPGAPAMGDAYLVPTGATGVWSTHVGDLAIYYSTDWLYFDPVEGMKLRAADTDAGLLYSGAAWVGTDIGGRTIAGTSDTPTLLDANGFMYFTNAAAIAATIPTNASVPYPLWTRLNYIQAAAGQVTIAGDTGVTVNIADLFVNKTYGQWAVVTALKVATNTWILAGTLELA